MTAQLNAVRVADAVARAERGDRAADVVALIRADAKRCWNCGESPAVGCCEFGAVTS